ncbi:MAG: outer membrane beta-barrel protein [Bacteroidota bacterium]|nr:outer membrane beta-barrel protein [Bacteroidota bacterium]MDP4229774.1 outer membrane beta-barrel protein [Bacteroidota bacterium]MDP4237013.1 outer membrane beta-barrel protein [Bacteroidota bacterium]
MKKIALALFLLLGSIAPVAHAQMEYGIIGGINFAYFNKVPPLGDAVSSLGYMLGVRGSLGTNFFFEPAVEFASYGSTLQLDNGTDHKMRSNYIRVPLQVGLKVFEEAPVNVEVRAGLSESFLVSYTDEITAGTGPAFTKNDINFARTAAIIGGGVRVLFLKFDLEYEWGLTDFFKSTGGTQFRALYLILGGNF